MNRVLRIPVFLCLLAGPLCAGEDALFIPDDCELVASAVTLGAARETVDGKLRFRFQILLKEVSLGRVPEGRTLPVLVSSPLPELWKEAGRNVVETGETPLLLFLKAVGEGRKAHFVPVGEGIAYMDPARVRAFLEGLAPRVKQAVVDLDSEDFETREKAEKLLFRLGYASEASVREALAGGPSPEVAMRAKRILQGLPRRGTGGRWFIHQPDVNYRDDEVLIWRSPARDKRAFQLKPGTEVEIQEKVDGEQFGTIHIMYKIRTKDGRVGWVPKNWLRFKASDDEIRPLGPGEEITAEFLERLYLTAVKAWAKEYEEAEGKRRIKGFDKYLNDFSKKAGFEDWSDFAMKAAQDLGGEVFSRCLNGITRKHSEIMKKVTERMVRAAKEKEAEAEEKKD